MLTQNRQFQWFNEPSYIYPMIPASAATLLKENGFEVIWKDCIAEKWSYEQFLNYIKKEQPDLIAMETKTPVVKQHWTITDDIKSISKSAVVALMGDHVTAMPEESMNNCNVDFLLTRGDYDFLLLNIAKHLEYSDELEGGIWHRRNGKIENTGEYLTKNNLNLLPFVDRNLTKAYLYGEKWKKQVPFFYTMAGRDCWWGKCSFCAWTTLYPKYQVRSAENLLDEIGVLIDKYNAREIFDDTGTFPAGKWLNRFCEGMISRGYNKKILFSCNTRFGCIDRETAALMKKAGFRKLKIGLESANQKTLDRLNKGVNIKEVVENCKTISKEGLNIHLTVMVGYPWESREEMTNTLKFAGDLMNKGHIEMLQATTIVPYPGTPLYEMAVENNWFRLNHREYERYDMSETMLNTPGISSQEIKDMCGNLYKNFWSPQFILRHLMRIRSVDDIKYVLRGARAVMGHIKDFK